MNSHIRVFIIEADNADDLEVKINEGLAKVGSNASYLIGVVPCYPRAKAGFYTNWLVTCFAKS